MEAENIKVTASNIFALRKYVDAMRELNKFVKQNFGKKTREDVDVLSISPIVSDIHKELDVLTKKITEYEKRNHSVLGTGKFYMVRKDDHETDYVHIIKKHVDGKKINAEEIDVSIYDSSFVISAHLKETGNVIDSQSSTDILNAYYDDRVTEITEERWNEIKDMFLNDRNRLRA